MATNFERNSNQREITHSIIMNSLADEGVDSKNCLRESSQSAELDDIAKFPTSQDGNEKRTMKPSTFRRSATQPSISARNWRNKFGPEFDTTDRPELVKMQLKWSCARTRKMV